MKKAIFFLNKRNILINTLVKSHKLSNRLTKLGGFVRRWSNDHGRTFNCICLYRTLNVLFWTCTWVYWKNNGQTCLYSWNVNRVFWKGITQKNKSWIFEALWRYRKAAFLYPKRGDILCFAPTISILKHKFSIGSKTPMMTKFSRMEQQSQERFISTWNASRMNVELIITADVTIINPTAIKKRWENGQILLYNILTCF